MNNKAIASFHLFLCLIICLNCATRRVSSTDVHAVKGPAQLKNSRMKKRVQGQYLVTLKKNAQQQIIRELLEKYGIEKITKIQSHTFLVAIAHDPGPDVICSIIHADIDKIQPNYVYTAM